MLTVLVLLAPVACSYAQGIVAAPMPPCAGAVPNPPYATPEAAPAVLTWTNQTAHWKAPACLGWPSTRFRLITALSASFHQDVDGAALLARFGAV